MQRAFVGYRTYVMGHVILLRPAVAPSLSAQRSIQRLQLALSYNPYNACPAAQYKKDDRQPVPRELGAQARLLRAAGLPVFRKCLGKSSFPATPCLRCAEYGTFARFIIGRSDDFVKPLRIRRSLQPTIVGWYHDWLRPDRNSH